MAVAKATKGFTPRSSLHLVVPKAGQFQRFIDDGLIVPGQINDDKDIFAPLDFTSISAKEVGRQHSIWAVRLSHLLYLSGNLRAEIGNLKHDLKNMESSWMVRRQGGFKYKWEAEHAMGRSKRIKSLRDSLNRADETLTRYEALGESYRMLMMAASREMSRRTDERASND